MSEARHSGDEPQVKTGIPEVDASLPLFPGRVYLVGGVPFVGKTTFAVSVALGAAEAGFRVALVTPTESPFEVELRLAAALASVDLRQASDPLPEPGAEERLQGGRKALKELPLRHLGEPLMDWLELKASLRPAGSVDLLVIDDLQAFPLIQDLEATATSGAFRRGEALKWLARWDRVPVLATLSMEVPGRPDPSPVLSDFPRDLVRAANVTIALHRGVYFSGVDYSLPKPMREYQERSATAVVLWDDQGLNRGIPLELFHSEGPVFR